MLATHPPSSSPPFAVPFLPHRPSPLSPRSANIHGPARVAPMTDNATPTRDGQENNSNFHKDANTNKPLFASNASLSHIPFSKRPVKKAPSPKSDELKERRRELFLRKVRDGREERRFEARGEDIMRLDFMRRQRAWEAERARDAPAPADEMGEDEYELPTSSAGMQFSQPTSTQEEEADEVARREDRELEALLEMMPGDEEAQQEQASSANLWSDDDEEGYQELFEELMGRGGETQEEQGPMQADVGEAMDMS